tara:strand:+ start:6127 stop:6540 length:414 start_codon:yes stop_codon:yes gene_type:complete
MKPNPNLAVKATLYWPNLNVVNKKSGKYQVDLANLSPAAVTALGEQGVNVRNKSDDRDNFITVKSKYTIDPVSPEGDVVEAMIGNGTTATVNLKVKNGRHPEFGPYTLASVQKLVVEDIVEYEGGDEEEAVEYADAL